MMRTGTAILVALSAVFAVTGLAWAQDEESTVKTADFPKVFERIAGSARAQAAYRACPADVFDKGRPAWRVIWDETIGDDAVERSDCEQNPLGCLSNCLGWRSGESCFTLAQTLQDNAEEKDHAAWEALFSEACSLGRAGGCTNRGGGIKNAGHKDGPFPDPEAPEAASCLFRTFQTACGAEDAWGCAMAGMTYQFGEGVPRNPAAAKSLYDRTCAIDAAFSACETAKEQIESLTDTEEK